jgi:hypothetical protein
VSLVKTSVCKWLKYGVFYATVGFDTAAAANPTAVVSWAVVSLGTTEAAWASFSDSATPDQAMVRVTTVECIATHTDDATINLHREWHRPHFLYAGAE